MRVCGFLRKGIKKIIKINIILSKNKRKLPLF